MYNQNSIFHLATEQKDLPELNEGLADFNLEQVQIQRSYTGESSFGDGDINLKFSVGQGKWWLPSKSYMRIRAQFQDAAGNALEIVDDISPSMNFVGNLFRGAELRLNNKTISKISENFPQVDTFCQRIYKSKSQLDSQLSDLQWMQPSFKERQALVCSDGHYSRDGGYFSQIVHTPVTSLGFVAADTFAIAVTGVATYTPNAGGNLNNLLKPGDIIEILAAVGAYAVGEKYLVTEITSNVLCKVIRTDGTAIQARAADAIFTDARSEITRKEYGNRDDLSNQKSNIEGVWQPLALPIWRYDGAIPAGNYNLVLQTQDSSNWQEYMIQSGYVDKTKTTDFKINIIDCFLYVCTVEGPQIQDDTEYMLPMDEVICQIQDTDVNSTGNQFKRFTVRPSSQALAVAFQDRSVGANNTMIPASTLKIRDDGELGLEELYILYNGVQKPQPRADVQFDGANDYLKQRYMENLIYSGNYFNQGGNESYQDWLDRGMFFYFSWPKNSNNGSDQVSVNFKFRTSVGSNGNVLLFDFAKKIAFVKMENNMVRDVRIAEY